MHFSYFEAVLAFLGIASIAIGSCAERLAEYVLREPQPTSTGRLRRQG